MSGLRKILVGADGSDTAARGLRFAIERAKRHGASIGVGYAVNRTYVAMATANAYGYVDPTPMLEAIDDEAAAVIGSSIATAKAFGVSANGIKLEGSPADAIAEQAKQMRADLVVVGTHGRRGIGRLFIGSVADGVIRTCTAPVFVVPSGAAAPVGSLSRALVCIDGSPASEMALSFALRIAEVEKTRLTMCAVVEPESGTDELYAPFLQAEIETKARATLARACERAANAPGAVESQLLRGDAIAQIVSFAERMSADCIFAGTHGRAGLPRLILGSVASGLLQSSRVPVCTVRHR